jgi:general secretion pathway protein A
MQPKSQVNVYLPFFKLRKSPFSMTPDPRFFFQSKTHLDALAALVYGIRERKGFILLTGNVGTGKTTVLRTLLENINPSVVFSHIFNTDVTYLELLQMICSDFGLPIAGRSKVELTEDLFSFLVETRLEGKTALVVIDEAQNLAPEVMESMRMLSNLETPRDKLIQILLCGQPELQEKLKREELRQLAQRVVVSCELSSLSHREVERYIYQRMQISGAQGDEIFPETVVRRIARLSGGVPRLVNILCDACLLLAYADGKREVNDVLLTAAAEKCLSLSPRKIEECEAEEGAEVNGKKRRMSFFRRFAAHSGRVAMLILLMMILAMGFIELHRSVSSPPLKCDNPAAREEPTSGLIHQGLPHGNWTNRLN